MRNRNVFPNRENCSLSELETSIKSARLKRTSNRLLAIKALWQDITFESVCQLFSISDTTLYNWIHRFNLQGLDGLMPRQKSGRPRTISKQDFAKQLDVLEKPQSVGETHWTAKKFHGYLIDELKKEVSYSTITRYLKSENYTLKVPRSWPTKQDEDAREAFVLKLKELSNDPNVEILYLDEVGFDGDPRPRRKWAKRGDSLKIPHSGKHLRMNATGMVCPETGEFLALEFDYSDRHTFQVFLDFANQEIQENGKRQIIILDNASWHKSSSIRWGHFEPLFLPPYSPDFNPIERLWLYIKMKYFTSFVAKDMDQLIEQIETAFNALFQQPSVISSVCGSS